MKRPGILFTAILSLALFSCSRNADADLLRNVKASLEGSWRMVLVKDHASGLIYTKPGAIPGEVDLTFVAVNSGKGFINGKTPTNTLFADYTVYTLGGEGKITIPSVAATKIAETSWGLDFLYNVTRSDSYSFEPDGKLRIHTEKKTLYFEKN